MAYKDLPEKLLTQVHPTDVQNYARSTGWNRVPEVPGEIAVYRRPGSGLDEIIVPQNPDYGDYGRRMAEVLSVLGEVERRAPREVLEDLLTPPSDTLRFRVQSQNTEGGTVPLPEGINLLAGAKKALLASACDVLSPQPFHPRLRRAEAEQFINACRLGQTERGSFVASLICPLNAVPSEAVGAQEAMFPELSPESLTRRVTAHLMQAMNRVVEAVNADQPERLVTFAAEERIVSANLYEALVEMQPTGDRSLLDVIATWARTAPPQTKIPQRVSLRQEYFPIIEEAARKLRPRAEPGPEPDVFVGIVDALNGARGEDGRMQGPVTLSVMAQESEEVLKVRLDLAPDDYEVACDAHKAGQFVAVRGVLHRGHRLHYIRDYRNFRIVNPTK